MVLWLQDLKQIRLISILNVIETNKVKKRILFNGTRYSNIVKGPKTSKTASILNVIKTNKVKKECYLMGQDIAI